MLGSAPAPKALLEQLADLAAARQSGQGAVDREPEVVVAARECQRIGLEAEHPVRELQPIAERGVHQVVEQDGAVTEIGGELARSQFLDGVGMARHGDDLG